MIGSQPRAARLGGDLHLVVGAPRVGDEAVELPAPGGRGTIVLSVGRLVESPIGLGIDDVSLTTFLRTELAALDAPARVTALRFIVTSVAEDLDGAAGLALAKKLNVVRDALRERLPYSVPGPDEPIALHVDDIRGIDERMFWLKGWVRGADSPGATLEFMSPEGCAVEVLKSAFRYRRHVEDAGAGVESERRTRGFLACVELEVPSLLSGGWVVQLRDPVGGAIEVEAPRAKRDGMDARDAIIGDLGEVAGARTHLIAGHAFRAVARVQERAAEMAVVERDERYGAAAAEPAVSIVIPVSGQAGALEHQLLHLSRDPEMAAAELIFVADPAVAGIVSSKAAELHWLYEIPFRLVSLGQQAGRAAMLNAGASLARAPQLLLMSPDVFADAPGWLGTMLAFGSGRPEVGAVGPMLLYEDGSVQHAGIDFRPVSPQELQLVESTNGLELREPRHRFKGLPDTVPGATESRLVPAVTTACMLVSRALYERVGRLRNAFIGSDFEASDLCLRLAEAGHENWYLPAARLRHLERPANAGAEPAAAQYDVIAHSHLWGERIEALVS